MLSKTIFVEDGANLFKLDRSLNDFGDLWDG